MKKLVAVALALAGGLGAGLSHARGNDVQWSVTIGVPFSGAVYSQPYPAYSQPYPVYSQPYPVVSYPVPVVTPGYPAYPRQAQRQTLHWDRDRDGIPDRYDRVYNPSWDRDGDGVPNRYDRVYNPSWDRDGDGVPNRQDRRDGRNDRGWRR